MTGTEPIRYPNDLRLVRALLAGNAEAAVNFAERLHCIPRILLAENARFGRPLNEHDLADLAGDAVVVILQKLALFEGRGELEGWIHRICCLEFRNSIRRKRRAPRTVGDEIETLDRPDPVTQVSAADDDDRVGRALRRLGGAEAEIISLKHFGGLTLDEIARRLDTPIGTVKTRYYRGLMRLQSLLGREEGDAKS